MNFVCVKYGYCGCVKDGHSLHVTDIIPTSGPVTASQFVDWLLLAEDLNPNTDTEHKEILQQAFTEIMGSDCVDAHKLRWPDAPTPTTRAREKFRGPLN